ncbi:MAG: patatin-like phospholipase family protein, partial [Cyanobacteria bacterium]|nr:patatin-like phospholipase family protein [Cyanobacteriota bacterium]
EKLFLNGRVQKAFFPKPRILQSVLYVPRYTLVRALTPFSPPIGLYSGKSLAKFIDENLPPNVRNIEDLKIPAAFTAVNLVDTKPVWMVKGSISRAVQASCSVPFMYRPVRTDDGAILIDGGIRSNLPTDVAEAAGAPLVVAVKLHSYLNKVDNKKGFPNVTAYADRITSVVMAEVEGKAVADADILIEPKVQYVPLETFDKPELIKAAIQAGEDAARAAVPEIKRRLSFSTAATKTSPGY